MRTRLSLYPAALVLLALFVTSVGCSKAPTDAQVSSDIQSKFSADSGLQGKQLGVQAEKGTVTITGTVDNEAQRDAAARYASSAAGVKQVVNNIQIANASAQPDDQSMQGQSMMMQAQPAAAKPEKSHKPSAGVTSKPEQADNAMQSSAANSQPPAPPQDASASQQPAPATAEQPATSTAPALPPPPQEVTVPTGTRLAVRLVDEINTKTAQQGELFHATLKSPISVSGSVVIPAGYTVEGHIVAVQSAGQYTGQSTLTLQLDRMTVGGKHYYLQTDQFHQEASSRSKNTAEKVGGGAVVGAILGGIFGGGKGAAIGAGAGGAAGGGVQAATKSKQIDLPAETLLHFTLQAPVTVTATSQGPEGDRPKLDSDNQ
jgi:hypothetical protein